MAVLDLFEQDATWRHKTGLRTYRMNIDSEKLGDEEVYEI
jgi:hypothetical protein